jgi:hypothetical protein
MMSHNAFEMLILPLFIRLTLIYLALAVVHALFSLIRKPTQRSPQPAPQLQTAIDSDRVPTVSPVSLASRARALRPTERIERSSRAQSLSRAATNMAQGALLP